MSVLRRHTSPPSQPQEAGGKRNEVGGRRRKKSLLQKWHAPGMAGKYSPSKRKVCRTLVVETRNKVLHLQIWDAPHLIQQSDLSRKFLSLLGNFGTGNFGTGGRGGKRECLLIGCCLHLKSHCCICMLDWFLSRGVGFRGLGGVHLNYVISQILLLKSSLLPCSPAPPAPLLPCSMHPLLGRVWGGACKYEMHPFRW